MALNLRAILLKIWLMNNFQCIQTFIKGVPTKWLNLSRTKQWRFIAIPSVVKYLGAYCSASNIALFRLTLVTVVWLNLFAKRP